MRLMQPTRDVSGVYAVTISASSQCGTGLGKGNLPGEARSRSYTMHVFQQGSRLDGQLSGPGAGGVPFKGRVEPGRILWEVYNENEFSSSEVLVDRSPSGALLVADGDATVAASDNPFTGTLSGTLAVLDPVQQRTGPPLASCTSSDHRFVMAR